MARWSKCKKRIEEFICEGLKDRVNFYATVLGKLTIKEVRFGLNLIRR